MLQPPRWIRKKQNCIAAASVNVYSGKAYESYANPLICQCKCKPKSSSWSSAAFMNAISLGHTKSHEEPSGTIRMPTWISRLVGYTAIRMVSEAIRSRRMPSRAMVMPSRRHDAVKTPSWSSHLVYCRHDVYALRRFTSANVCSL